MWQHSPSPPTPAEVGRRVWEGPGDREGCSPLAALTHDGQGSGLAQLAPRGLDHLQVAAIQVTPVDGAIARADPVQFALWVVNGQA